MNRVLLLALLLTVPAVMPGTPSSAAQGAPAPWWNEGYHFRIPLTLTPDGSDPVSGVPVDLTGAKNALVLVPLDVTGALRESGAWPFDAAGRPVAWTFDPQSVRAVAVDADGRPGDVLAARFHEFTLAPGDDARPFDPRTHAAGTLALVLPGPFDAPRRVDVYFDIRERGAPAADAPHPLDAARLAHLGGAGPAVRFMAPVPPTPPGARTDLVALAADGDAILHVERVSRGTAPETVADDVTVTATRPTRIPIPTTETGYELHVRASGRVLLALDTGGTASPPAGLFVPALGGGYAGHAFLVPGLAGAAAERTVDVVAAAEAATVRVTDAATGRDVATLDVPRLGSRPLTVPADALLRVDASAPVLVLARGGATDAGSAYLQQAAGAHGAPEDTLLVGGRAGGHAVLTTQPATIRGFPLDRPGDAVNGRAGDPPRYAWVSRTGAEDTSEPWAFYTDAAPMTALLGSEGHTALVGEAGLRWRVPVATDRPSDADPADRPLMGTLLTPFPATEVTAHHRALNGSRTATASVTLSAPTALTAFPDGSRNLVEENRVIEVTTSRPAFLYAGRTGTPFTGFLPGLPPVAGVDAQPLEAFGALLTWREPTHTVAARPGEQARVPLELSNLGRTASGAPLTEDVTLSLAPVGNGPCRADWDAGLTAANLPGFPAPQARTVTVLVTVPDNTEADACAEFTVTAASGHEPDVRAQTRIVVRARAAFEPALDVLTPDEGASDRAVVRVEAGGTATARLRLRNLGSASGEALVGFAPGPGYTVKLVREDTGHVIADADGRAVQPVPVTENGSVTLRMELQAPETLAEPWDFFVQATSAADPSARDDVTLTATPVSNLSLVATPSAPRLTPTPGGSANATLHLRNLGPDVEVQLDAATALPAGWTVAFEPARLLLRASGAAGADGTPLDVAEVRVNVTAPANASLGVPLPLTLAVTPTLAPSAALRVPLPVLPVNDYHLIVPDRPVASVTPGEARSVPVQLANEGAGAFNLSLRTLVAPDGWHATLGALPARLETGATGIARLDVTPAPGTPPGARTVVAELTLRDGVSPDHRHALSFHLVVPERAALRWAPAPADAVVLAPGDAARVRFTVTNDGNAPVSTTPEATATGGARARVNPPDRIHVLPGANASIELLVRAPPDAGYGDATVHLTLPGDHGDLTRTLRIQEARHDLTVADAELRKGPDGAAFVHVTVTNGGDRGVPGLHLELVDASDDRVLATLEAGALAEGATATHVLPAHGGDASALRVRVSAADGVADAAPADNAAPVRTDEPPATREAGQPIAPFAVLLGAVAAIHLRRWRR